MLSFQSVGLRRGQKLLFGDATFAVHAGQKVGVAGANGCGKSSLFSVVRGELAVDTGELSVPRQWVIAHVAQETPALERPALDYVMDGDGQLRDIERRLRQAEAAGDGLAQARCHGELEAIDGFGARARAGRLMHGLGFTADQEGLPVHSFSGGWRMRLNLAQALMCRSDLLLLDEPTNHLDLDAVIWLQDWLRGYPGTLLLISHDRDFLDEVADHMLHIEHQQVRLYTGNYSAFEVLRAQALAGQQAAYAKQQRQVAHIERYVERFRAKATKARQAQSRLKALERMERIAPAHVDSPFSFAFAEPDAVPDPLLQLRHVDVGYGGAPVLSDVQLSLVPGARIGLLGRNGAGKSTLIKLLAGELAAQAGELQAAKRLQIGYFAQHQLEQLRGEDTPLQHLRRLDPEAAEQGLRDFLGGFGFGGDMALSPVAPFSGGEKARLVLALLVYQRPNLLLLDEPTNHLDLEMRHALALALQDFEGALVVVSHDRHLLRTVTDEFLLVMDGRVECFDGDLDDYRRRLLGSTASEQPAAASVEQQGGETAKDRRRRAAQERERLQPLRRRLQALEKDLERLQRERDVLEQRLADPDCYADAHKDELKQLLLHKARIDADLETTEHAWLEAGEALEVAQSGDD